jgi:hypothetical protein
MTNIAKSITRGVIYVLIVMATLEAAACRYGGTPGPAFAAPYDSVPADTLLAYIRTLQFDDREWAGDKQRLMVGTCPNSCSHGPLVRIEPERRAHRNERADLENSQGRIIARMINYDATLSYPKYNLGPSDTVYWVVSRVGSPTRERAKGTAMYISVQGLKGRKKPPITYDSAVVESHNEYSRTHDYGYYPGVALAQWIWNDSDETKWGSCNQGACCR